MKGKLKTYQYYGAAKKRRWPLIAGVVVGILLFSGGGYAFYQRQTPAPVTNQAATPTLPEPKATVTPTSVAGKYLFSGTIVLARAVERGALSGGTYDYSQPFSAMSTFEPATYDAWLADMECPVTPAVISYEQQVQNLIFNCRTDWLPELAKYYKFLNLANNHTADMGADGFLETQKNIEAAGIQTIGNYRPSVLEDNCDVMAVPVRVKMSDASVQKGTLPIAFCAFHYFSFRPGAGEMEQVAEYAKVMPVFSFMHAGVEYLPKAGTDQTNIARNLIDLGSEFVIGNSPHWVQNSEAYKGKLIAYSTGNFIFDQLDAETNRGLNISTTMEVSYDDNVAKWLAIGESCKARNDDCLQKAQIQGLKKISLKLTHEPIASSGGNRTVTKRATPAVQKAVEERLEWSKTLAGLTNN